MSESLEVKDNRNDERLNEDELPELHTQSNSNPSRPELFSYPEDTDLQKVLEDFLPNNPDESFYFLNEKKLRENIKVFQDNFLPKETRRRIAYAVKANTLPRILEILKEEGITSFDCASLKECQDVKEVQPDSEIFFNNPNKNRKDIVATSKNHNVSHFTASRQDEVEKIIKNYKGDPKDLEIAIRLGTPNKDASINLSQKYSTSQDKVLKMLEYISKESEASLGLAVHVGSQNSNLDILNHVAKQLREIIGNTRKEIKTINFGGGMPVLPELSQVANQLLLTNYLEHLSTAIRKNILDILPKDGKIIIEPGRGIIGSAVDLVVSTLGVDREENPPVIIMNDGVFTSFSDHTIHDWEYSAGAINKYGKRILGNTIPYRVHGRTCDSGDTFRKLKELPENFTEEDYLFFPNAGAYISCQASYFNGLKPHSYISYNP